jgi:hypothetical protein
MFVSSRGSSARMRGQRQDQVRFARRMALSRHGRHLGIFGILHDGQAAALPDAGHAAGAVVVGAGQQDAGQAGP